MGPAGFSAYARLRFIPDPMNGGQSESDVGRDDESPSDADQLRTAVETLLPHTRTPDEGYLLIWEGWGRGAFPRGAFTAPRLTLPDRACLMFRVRLPDFASSFGRQMSAAAGVHGLGNPRRSPPSLNVTVGLPGGTMAG